MTNPFEDNNEEYLALVNHEDQHSLWPAFIDVPDGWSVGYGPAKREDCLSFVEEQWQDLRPRSLIRLMESEQ
ncbi:protein mbtH [Nocardiopsis sp. CNR-923]|uniref:MbtH family protein n=1 Tax=Nocardiopsis sp. CNR-923 TaxID=1904965 RepID=UPI00095B9E85|nr:MbtH family protein [Nocardiopsis sp. CNR-923]OLT27951.1 protein mbtH [Nocardiopsis sp. CNR-923]